MSSKFKDERDPADPFSLDFMEQIKPEHWTLYSGIQSQALSAALSPNLQTLTFRFASGHEEVIQREDIEALTRYLNDYAQVAPLPLVDEDVFKDIHPRRVELQEEE